MLFGVELEPKAQLLVTTLLYDGLCSPGQLTAVQGKVTLLPRVVTVPVTFTWSGGELSDPTDVPPPRGLEDTQAGTWYADQ